MRIQIFHIHTYKSDFFPIRANFFAATCFTIREMELFFFLRKKKLKKKNELHLKMVEKR